MTIELRSLLEDKAQLTCCECGDSTRDTGSTLNGARSGPLCQRCSEHLVCHNDFNALCPICWIKSEQAQEEGERIRLRLKKLGETGDQNATNGGA